MLGTLGDRYVLLQEIGRGGMAVVFLAHDNRLDRDVAIKLLKTDPPPPPEVLRLFHQEARATSSLTHPNIVNLYDFGELPDGQIYLVMELLTGRSLAHLLAEQQAEEKTMPWPRAADIALQICAALSAAHGKRILHRDLTPANCFRIDAPGVRRDHIKILDFGIAQVRGITQTASVLHPPTKEPIMGTPYYMAPEILREERGDHRVDIYGVGVLLYEMTVGARPFNAGNLFVLLRTITEGNFLHPRAANPSARLGEEGEAIILRAMANDPAQRYQSAAELADALEASLALPKSKPPDPPPQDPLPVKKRLKWSPLIALAAALLVAIGLSASKFGGGDDLLPPPPKPSPDRNAPIATLKEQRQRELADGLKRTKKQRDDCLLETQSLVGSTYLLPVEVSVARDGKALARLYEDSAVPDESRLSVPAAECILRVLASIHFTAAADDVTFTTRSVID